MPIILPGPVISKACKFLSSGTRTPFIHNPKFNVADVLAVGARSRIMLGQQLNPLRHARRFQDEITVCAAVRAAGSLEFRLKGTCQCRRT